ncbi:hypothetical protein ACFPJ1_43075 [Kribbella qitaiheensis]|uniref:hypothetical protein n=1 Tax=Kribbella qitaiheensis TaxID=1544730 RepID=UPI003605E1C9
MQQLAALLPQLSATLSRSSGQAGQWEAVDEPSASDELPIDATRLAAHVTQTLNEAETEQPRPEQTGPGADTSASEHP